MQNCSTGAQEATGTPAPTRIVFNNWPDKTLYDILARKEYLGHTITGKSYKVSYKSKKTKKNPEEKQYFFPNTHEPLIDEETFDLAQKRIATKHRPTKTEEIDIFRGFSFVGTAATKCICKQGAGTTGTQTRLHLREVPKQDKDWRALHYPLYPKERP